MNKRLLIVLILGFSSGMPYALISSTLQAWFSSAGMSVMATGTLSLLGLPYVYRMLWAPILDRYSLFNIGKRRSWILVMQILLLLGFNLLAWLSPLTHPNLMMSLALLLACFSATQDIAIDAQRTEYLFPTEYGLGASLAVFGYRVALLVAGGLMLIIAQHLGWAMAYRIAGGLMIPGMIAIVWSPEPSQPVVNQKGLKALFIQPIKDLASRQGVVALLLFIFMYKLGEAFTTTTSGIVMPFLIQGIGYSLDTIAYVKKILGVNAIVMGGFSAGFLLRKWSLYRALFVLGLLQAITNLLFVAIAMVGKNVPLLAAAVVSDNFAAGMGTTALVALFMQIVNRQFTATQFSILVAFSALPRILSGPIAAILQSWLGWVGLYALSFVFALGYIPFLMLSKRGVTFRTCMQEKN